VEGKRISVRFYRQASGREPVRDWLLNLSPADRLTVGTNIKTVEFGWPIGMPTCRPLSNGLWEVRSDLSDGRISRVVFMIAGANMILLTAFIKKSQKTPDDQMRLARSRKREVES
jgi:phage-related protein